MKVIRDLKILVKKQEILRAVAAYHDLSHLHDLDGAFAEMRDLAFKYIDPVGMFIMEDMSEEVLQEVKNSIVKDCRHIVFCAFTLGDRITEEIDRMFEENKFDDAILLDAISTSILFHMSGQLYEEIFEHARNKGLGLTCRIAPGDGEVDIGFQKQIIERLSTNEADTFRIENDCIVKPYKTITYIYGADESIRINKEDHNCKRCHNYNCYMRDSEAKIRGSFVEEMEILVPEMC